MHEIEFYISVYSSHILLLILMQIIYVFMCISIYTYMYKHIYYPTLGVGDEKGGLVCCSPWGHKESDTTERLN